MTILAIDPDTKACGCAEVEPWAEGRLVSVWVQVPGDLANHAQGGVSPRLSRVVVERPAYQGQRSDNARTQDLMTLAWAGGTLAAWYAGRHGAQLVALPPSDARDPLCKAHTRKARAEGVRCTCARGWKGSEPKPVMHARAWDLLTPQERALFPPYTGDRIRVAVDKGARDRWSKPGGSYYPKAFDETCDKLDAMCLAFVYVGRMKRR